jgi:hypothetical protein
MESLGEEFASRMERRRHVANTRGALMEPGREEFAPLMERSLIVATTRGALIKPSWAEFVSLMARRLNVAATRGASNSLKREDFVGGMARSLSPLPRAKRDSPPSLSRDLRLRPRVLSPEVAEKSARAICKRTQVVPLLVNRHPLVRLPLPQTLPMTRSLVLGFTRIGIV